MSPALKEFLSLILDWFNKTMPTFLAGLSIGYKVMNGRLSEAKMRIIELEMQVQYEKNKAIVEANNSGKSDSDIIDDAIKSGLQSEREMPERERHEGPRTP